MATSRCFCTAAALLVAATLARGEEIQLAAINAAPERPVAAPVPGVAVPGTAPAAAPAPAGGEKQFQPTWETQKHARTYLLSIPAPRGQIVDRNGEPLAQTRVSYNLGVVFPTPLEFSETQALAFLQKQADLARRIGGRQIS
jgi:penicillin-binding protein 2